MLRKCFTKQNLCWKFILKDSLIRMSYSSVGNNSLSRIALNLHDKSLIEFFLHDYKMHSIGSNFHLNQQHFLNCLIQKLMHYSLINSTKKETETLITIVSDYKSHKILNSNFRSNSIEFFNSQNDISGRQIVENVINCYMEENSVLSDAQNSWRKGNIRNSFQIFSNLYDETNPGLKDIILRVLQILIFKTVAIKGIAITSAIIKESQKFSCEKGQYSILAVVWYSLFTSEFFEDTCTAKQVLSSNLQFQHYLDKHVLRIGHVFLKNDELANYQRLLETTLQYNMESSLDLLRALFTYYYKSGYFQGCTTVYNCCNDLGLKLTPDQLYKYSIVKQIGSIKKVKSVQFCSPKEIKYKF